MRVAVATDNSMVSAHFGRCSEYTLAEVAGERVTGSEVIANPGHEPGFLPAYLAERGVEVVICGGAGPRAQALFAERGIRMCMDGHEQRQLDHCHLRGKRQRHWYRHLLGGGQLQS